MTNKNSYGEAAIAPASSRLELFRVWLGIGCLSFGGPAAQIALMHRVIVDQRAWLSERQYLNALSFCMLLPGPEAMQLATFSGWRTHGITGGLVAGLCFVMPGAFVIAALATIYALYGELSVTANLFLGIKAAVLIIVIDALIKVSRRALTGRQHYLTAVIAFIAIFFFAVPFPLLVLGAGMAGFWLAGRTAASSSVAQAASGPITSGATSRPTIDLPERHVKSTLRTISLWLLIWWLPVLGLWLFQGEGLLLSLALFFSKLAIVTFGGAYAVLAYMAQDVVINHQWLDATQMMDALGLAETTPGPLILVTEFVGFLTGFSAGGMALALAAAMVTLWVTFVPCFLWIFAGAPYMDWLANQPRLSGALSSITAAVVGVILNLSLWFALHVLFDQVDVERTGIMQVWSPVLSSWNPMVLGLAAMCAFLLFKLKLSVISMLGISAAVALGFSLLI